MGKEILALRAEGIEFIDPGSGEKLRYMLPSLNLVDV
jgi:hypothetical protein